MEAYYVVTHLRAGSCLAFVRSCCGLDMVYSPRAHVPATGSTVIVTVR